MRAVPRLWPLEQEVSLMAPAEAPGKLALQPLQARHEPS